MEILFHNDHICSPKVSIILVDWSCRESFHILRYLANQTIPRKEFEIIWIEYYNRRSPEIEAGIKESEKNGRPPMVDQWIVMEIPDQVYFHKHLMYNIGIIAGRGKIITVCDSDAMVRSTFVRSIVMSFEGNRNIVLHMDEVRNNSAKFYPFNDPSIEQVMSQGCINWKGGKTRGLLDEKDPLHTRNYGACMSALRDDLINIGGADEHVNYLGHICGPYEMTFRLVNAGKQEVWHQEEFLYHVWHPGQAGNDDFLGPHDGKSISTTALLARSAKRVFPLVENPAIRILRLKQDEMPQEGLVYQAIPKENMKDWASKRLRQRKGLLSKLKNLVDQPAIVQEIGVTLLKVLLRQIFKRIPELLKRPESVKEIWREVYKNYLFLTNMNKYNAYAMEWCKNCLKTLASNGITEIALYGTGDVAGMFYHLALSSPVRIRAIYDHLGGNKCLGLDVMPVESIKHYSGKIVITTLIGVENEVEELRGMGVKDEQVIIL